MTNKCLLFKYEGINTFVDQTVIKSMMFIDGMLMQALLDVDQMLMRPIMGVDQRVQALEHQMK